MHAPVAEEIIPFLARKPSLIPQQDGQASGNLLVLRVLSSLKKQTLLTGA